MYIFNRLLLQSLGALCLIGANDHLFAQASSYLDRWCTREIVYEADVLKAGGDLFFPQYCFIFDNTERCYDVYIPAPASCTGKQEIPLVVDMHAERSCPFLHSAYSGWAEKANEECFVVVYPNPQRLAFSTCFQVQGGAQTDEDAPKPCCCKNSDGSQKTDGNDAVFIKAVIDHVLDQGLGNAIDKMIAVGFNDDYDNFEDDKLGKFLQLDPNRIYMAGHSNGCMLALAMAAQYSDVIAAVACHAGALLTPFAQNYSPVPIWLAHGKDDGVFKFDGDDEMGIWSIPQTIDYLEEKNECDTEARQESESADGVVVSQSRGCKNGANIEVVQLEESGHFPYRYLEAYGSDIEIFVEWPRLSGTDTYEVAAVDTVAMAWEFVRKVGVPTESSSTIPS